MSSDLITGPVFPPIGKDALAKLQDVESRLLDVEQVEIVTEHIIHGGMYARTVRIPAGVMITGALIKRATMLVFHGYADTMIGDEWGVVRGYGVICGSAGRKQVFITRSDVEMTMIFPTQARTVEEAEREFTDEADRLMSRRSSKDLIVITGE